MPLDRSHRSDPVDAGRAEGREDEPREARDAVRLLLPMQLRDVIPMLGVLDAREKVLGREAPDKHK